MLQPLDSIDRRPCSGFQVLHHATQGKAVQDKTSLRVGDARS